MPFEYKVTVFISFLAGVGGCTGEKKKQIVAILFSSFAGHQNTFSIRIIIIFLMKRACEVSFERSHFLSTYNAVSRNEHGINMRPLSRRDVAASKIIQVAQIEIARLILNYTSRQFRALIKPAALLSREPPREGP